MSTLSRPFDNALEKGLNAKSEAFHVREKTESQAVTFASYALATVKVLTFLQKKLEVFRGPRKPCSRGPRATGQKTY